jgi:hypothetical protein
VNSGGKWVLWIVLIASAVALVMFAPKRPEIGQFVVEPASWSPPASTPETSKPAVQVRPDPSDSSTGPIVASDAAVAPAAARPAQVESPPSAADAAHLEIVVPSHAAIGTTIDILASVAPGKAASRADIVVLFDPSVLQLLSGGSAEPGRAEATIQSVINEGELGTAAFQFQIIASDPQGTIVTAAATAFDANGGEVKVIVPPPQEIALDRPPS